MGIAGLKPTYREITMDLRTLLAASAALLIPLGSFAASDTPPPSGEAPPPSAETPQAPPEGTPPEGTPPPAAPDPYAEINKLVQEKLQGIGLYDGPVNGDFGFNTQAALAQFQLSVPLPASGMLDEQTLAALGLQPDESGANPSAGASPPAEQGATAEAGAK